MKNMSRRLFYVVKNRIKYFQPTSLGFLNVRYKKAVSLTNNAPGKVFKTYESATNIMVRYERENVVPWEEIKSSILDVWTHSNPNINSIILNCCAQNKKSELAISFYKHMQENGQEPTLIEYYLLLSSLTEDPEIIKANKDLLLEIYNRIKPHLNVHRSLLEVASLVYRFIDHFWEEFVQKSDEFTYSETIRTSTASAAFDNDKPEIGWKELSKSPENFNALTLKAYLGYCLRKAEKGEFDSSLIDQILKYCSDEFSIVPFYKSLFDEINNILKVANNHKNGTHYWSAHRCEINHNNVCSHCELQLNEIQMTQEEFDILKDKFLNNVIISTNVYIKSTKHEVQRFLNFLREAHKYDVVIDGLNTFLKVRDSFVNVMSYFKQKDMRIFLITRKHSLQKRYFREAIKDCSGYFLTDNLSDDDVFTIYSAIHGGPGTYLYTNDYLRGYGDEFNEKRIQDIFRKWQLIHQYRVPKKGYVALPWNHGTIPQLTSVLGNRKQLIYHISYSNIIRPKYTNPVSWICLQGNPR